MYTKFTNKCYLCSVLCSSRTHPYSPHRRDWKFPRGGSFSKTENFKEMTGVNWNFQRGGGGGGGGLVKSPFCVEVQIFYGTTYYTNVKEFYRSKVFFIP